MTDADGPYDSADPVQVERQTRKAKLRELDNGKALKALLNEPPGRNWMWNLLGFCRVFATSFAHADPHATSFHEGMRNVGLKLLTDCMRDAPEGFALMFRENGGAR